MSNSNISQQVDDLLKRLDILQTQVSILPLRPELFSAAIEELQVTSEELQAAQEELLQQNGELIAARGIIEAQRQRYQELFDFAPDGYLVTDPEGVILEANHAAQAMLNIRQEFLTGKPLLLFIAEECRHAFHSQITRLHQTVSHLAPLDQQPIQFNRFPQEWELRLKPWANQSSDPLQPFEAALTVVAIWDRQTQRLSLRWLLRDITERKQAEAQVRYNAFHDSLTGLANRAFFLECLEQAHSHIKRQPDYKFGVLFLDLDRFKLINDSLGHAAGDLLLIAMARRLETCLRPTDRAARLGGDEFTVLLDDINGLSDVVLVAERIMAQLKLPFDLGGQEIFTSASIGIALSTAGYTQPEDLLRDADFALYQSKALGKGRTEIFKPAVHTQAVKQLKLETELQRAIAHQELQVHYQPIVCLASGKITGFEALVRWQHPDRGLLYPADFLPLAAETDLDLAIDRWVLGQACRQIVIWQRQFPHTPPLSISINLSSPQFGQPDLIEYIEQVLQETGLPAQSLKLELTETALLENSELIAATLSKLRDLRIALAIDDFGTGYSSLGRLQSFAIDDLKIDRSFVSRMDCEPNSSQASSPIVETIVTLAHNLGLAIVAEGIETIGQLTQLQQLNCEYGQGFFFSRALNSLAAEKLMEAESQGRPVWQLQPSGKSTQ